MSPTPTEPQHRSVRTPNPALLPGNFFSPGLDWGEGLQVCPPCLYLSFARQDQQNLRILTSGLRQLGLSCGNRGIMRGLR